MSSNHNDYKIHTFFDEEQKNFYTLDTEEKSLIKNGKNTGITRRPCEILILLIEKAGRTVRDEEFFLKIWGKKYVDKKNLRVQINELRSILDDKEQKTIIETMPSAGYKFNLKVETIPKIAAKQRIEAAHQVAGGSPQPAPDKSGSNEDTHVIGEATFGTKRVIIAVLGLLFGAVLIAIGLYFNNCSENCRFKLQIISVAAFFYAILTGVGVILEIAYQFDKYGWNAAKMTPSIVLMSGGAMFAGLNLADYQLQYGITTAALSGLAILLLAAVCCCIAALFVLPNRKIVVANFETQPAFTAFYKNVFLYFIPLYSFFILLIYCLYSFNLKRFEIAVFFIIIWILFFFFSFISTSLLSDKLLPQKGKTVYPYHGFYSALLFVRMILCFGPTGICAVIYLLGAVGAG